MEDLAALWIAQRFRRRSLDSAELEGSTTASRAALRQIVMAEQTCKFQVSRCTGRMENTRCTEQCEPNWEASFSQACTMVPRRASRWRNQRAQRRCGGGIVAKIVARRRAHCSQSERQSEASSGEVRRACVRTSARGRHGPRRGVERRRSSSHQVHRRQRGDAFGTEAMYLVRAQEGGR